MYSALIIPEMCSQPAWTPLVVMYLSNNGSHRQMCVDEITEFKLHIWIIFLMRIRDLKRFFSSTVYTKIVKSPKLLFWQLAQTKKLGKKTL